MNEIAKGTLPVDSTVPRYINVNALPMWDELFMQGKNDSGVWVRYRDVENMLKNAPTADVEEVKHGEWIEQHDPNDDPLFRRKWFCSVCGEWQTYGISKRCPECGAKMDGKR